MVGYLEFQPLKSCVRKSWVGIICYFKEKICIYHGKIGMEQGKTYYGSTLNGLD